MKVINFILVIVAMLMAITQSGFAEAAEVRSISREIIQKIGGKSFLQIRVTCAEVSEVRVISQLKRSGPWCSADLPEVCAKQKVKAAGKVCGTHFQKSLQQYNANRSVPEAEPEAEIVQQEQSEGVVESDIEIAAVAVPLSSESDTEDRGDDSERDSDLEKRYEEYIQSIDF